MIVTLTLNPAFDVHATLESFKAGHENLAEKVTRDVGGKGINISRALTANGIENRALVVTGDENAADFREGLNREKLDFAEITVPGRIRENITIHPASGDETRLSFRGFSAPGLLTKVEEILDVGEGDIVTFTGSLPGGVFADEAEEFLKKLVGAGVKVVIDSKSITLDQLRSIKPWLIKPNDEELEAYFGKLDDEKMLAAAKNLHADGIGNVAVSLGAKGSILVTGSGIFRAVPPKIDAVSTIGAGDSMIAGFIAATTLGVDDESKLRIASAFGTAACLREGTNPPLPADISRISAEFTIEQFN